jgi:hypothetical protein
MAGQWSVMPKILQLSNGEVMLAGGRPGLMLWVGGRDEGSSWRPINIAAEHNAGLAPGQLQEMGFESALTSLPSWTAPVPNDQDHKCCDHPNCTANGAWCQSTACECLACASVRMRAHVSILYRARNLTT